MATLILISALPVGALLLCLSVFRMQAWKAALLALALGLVLALVFCRAAATPSQLVSALGSGVGLALYPICLVIFAALSAYAVTVESGAMVTIRRGLSAVSDDQRILALLIVWGFGNFMEGMAGFGTAVAIPASILVGIGFDPLKAVLMCLVANTTPTAYGSVGVPLLTLARVSGTNVTVLTWYAAWMQLLVTAAGPFLVLLVLDGWRALKGLVPLLLLVDAAFLLPWVFAARFLGLELPDVLGGLAVMTLLIARALGKGVRLDLREQARAWLPFALVIVFLIILAILPAPLKSRISPGLLILLAAILGGACQGLGASRILTTLRQTLWNYRFAFLTICTVVALARVMGAAGMIAAIAEGLVRATGASYPFCAPLVGALGGFVTGSGTSANVLFGALQADAASKIGVLPEILAAANVMGAGIGKMICPQSIAIGAAAAGLVGSESRILRTAARYFIPVILLACAMTVVAVRLMK